jgi:succinylglutamate desuccinylase
MKKEILIIAATHGDERIGLEVYGNLSNMGLEKYFDFLIANPLALAEGKRFIDCDLNRSYPGAINSRLYEKRQAALNLALAKKYRYIIDLHEASSGTDDFIIVPRRRLPAADFLKFINLRKVLLWPEPRGPLGDVLPRCVELEFGLKKHARRDIIKKATKTVAAFLLAASDNKKIIPSSKSVYRVYGELRLGQYDGSIAKLKDFKNTKINNETFYPLLVGQYLKNKIVCYKMTKEKSPLLV